MTQLGFRDATATDIPTILQLSHAGAAKANRYPELDLSDPAYLQAFKDIDADPNHRLIVAERNGEIIGTMQISYLPGLPDQGRYRGQLENIHVRADQRGQGTGGKMIEWAIARCRERNCWVVQLTSNKVREEAHNFYGKLGFVPTHEGFKLAL